MKIKTKQITVTAIMLAICLVSQFFKNLSVYITGPIINAALILTVLYAGMACGIILSWDGILRRCQHCLFSWELSVDL